MHFGIIEIEQETMQTDEYGEQNHERTYKDRGGSHTGKRPAARIIQRLYQVH